MNKISKLGIFALATLALATTFSGPILAQTNQAFETALSYQSIAPRVSGNVAGTTFRVSHPNTWVGTSAGANGIEGSNRTTRIQTVGATFTRTSAPPVVAADGWTYIEGRLSGTDAQRNGIATNRVVWIATSQLERRNDAITCVITHNGTEVRNNFNNFTAPGSVDANTRFRLTLDGLGFNSNGDSWRLGTIINGVGTNAWNGRTMWVRANRMEC